jgi:hypothetical protein
MAGYGEDIDMTELTLGPPGKVGSSSSRYDPIHYSKTVLVKLIQDSYSIILVNYWVT